MVMCDEYVHDAGGNSPMRTFLESRDTAGLNIDAPKFVAVRDAYYGAAVTRRFGIAEPPATIVREIRNSIFAVTKIQCQSPRRDVTAPTPPENAYSLTVRLRDVTKARAWIGGRLQPDEGRPKDSSAFYDLTDELRFAVFEPIDSLNFYIHRNTLLEVSRETDTKSIDGLMVSCGSTVSDPTIAALAASVLPAMERQHEASELFLDHIAYSLLAHLSGRYGATVASRIAAAGGLAPWQLRRAKELIRGSLAGALRYSEVAAECGLSPGHFSRAFARSTGLPPHRWLMSLRIDLAKELLLQPTTQIAEIALTCGFADQAHFTRVFSSSVGLTPGRWRRASRG
jgi:AraC family transcriptional regulator